MKPVVGDRIIVIKENIFLNYEVGDTGTVVGTYPHEECDVDFDNGRTNYIVLTWEIRKLTKLDRALA